MDLCIACLAFDVKLYRLAANTFLNTCYQQLSGLKVQSYSKIGYICYQCLPLLYKYMKFKDSCIHTANLLSRIWQESSEVRQEIIISERKLLPFKSHLNITRNANIDILPTALKEKEEMLPHSNSIHIDKSFTVENKIENNNLTFHSDRSNNFIFDKQIIHLDDIMNESVPHETGMENVHQSDRDDDSPSNKQLIYSATQKELKKTKNIELKNNFVRTKQKSSFKEEFATEINLPLEEQIAELKVREFSSNYINCPIKCKFCFKGFLDMDAFDNHMAKHDKKVGTFVCGVCLLRYTNARRLREHTATAHSRRFKCNQCGHLSHTIKPTTHLNHMRKKHPSNSVCHICGLSFIGIHGLVMHKKKVHSKNAAQRNSDSTIDEEAENVDAQNGDRHCGDCDISFLTKSALTRHILSSSKHASESKCGNVCRICGASFPTRTCLTRHCRTHAPLLPRARMSCNDCDATFASGAGVRAHRARAHGDVGNASKQRCYVCDVCGKTFKSNAVLQYHLRIHTGERPYPCQDCPKRFPDKTQLSLHARTHSGERPYACSKCSAKFKQKGALNRHVKIHTGDKPHQCNMCHKTFSRMATLKNHVVSVHLTKLNSD